VLSGFRFSFPVEVRFRDLDAIGHVNNAVFLTYLESARIAYWLELTGRSSLAGMDMILARVEIDYRSPAGYREQLEVGARIASLRRSSFTMEQKIVERASQRLVAEARNVCVYYDYQAARSQPIPDELRRALLAANPEARQEA
jgi:acyl-CoA thioester hydrolase